MYKNVLIILVVNVNNQFQISKIGIFEFGFHRLEGGVNEAKKIREQLEPKSQK